MQDSTLVDEKSFFLNTLKCSGISCLSVSMVEVLGESMEVKHLVITCTLTVNNHQIPTHSLINCRASGIAFTDQHFARHHQIPVYE